MGRAAADDDHVEALDLEHRGEGVASISVRFIFVVGGEAGAHRFFCSVDVLPEMRLREMRLVGRRRLLLPPSRFFARATGCSAGGR